MNIWWLLLFVIYIHTCIYRKIYICSCVYIHEWINLCTYMYTWIYDGWCCFGAQGILATSMHVYTFWICILYMFTYVSNNMLYMYAPWCTCTRTYKYSYVCIYIQICSHIYMYIWIHMDTNINSKRIEIHIL